MIWHWPQIAYASLLALHLVMHMAHHGEDRGTFNAGFALADVAFAAALLYFGGFWTGGVAP